MSETNYYAKVLNGVVVDMKKASTDYMENYIDTSPGKWIQTSYNTRGGVHYDTETGLPSDDQSKALRGNYAGIGHEYHANLDIFIEPRPHISWTVNETTCRWEPPVPRPNDKNIYNWNEDNQTWDLVESE